MSVWNNVVHSFHSYLAAPALLSLRRCSPMSIPGALPAVPPPLPPPSHIPEISAGQDPGWQWGNDPNGADFGRPASVKPGSSLLGGAMSGMRQGKEHDSAAQYPHDPFRRGSSISTVTLSRDHEMHDEPSTYSDEDGNSSRPTSNGYVYIDTLA